MSFLHKAKVLSDQVNKIETLHAMQETKLVNQLQMLYIAAPNFNHLIIDHVNVLFNDRGRYRMTK